MMRLRSSCEMRLLWNHSSIVFDRWRSKVISEWPEAQQSLGMPHNVTFSSSHVPELVEHWCISRTVKSGASKLTNAAFEAVRFRHVGNCWKVDRGAVLETRTSVNGTAHFGPTVRTGQCDPPQKVVLFSRKFSTRTGPFHLISDRNFRKVWVNGKRPGYESFGSGFGWFRFANYTAR